MAEESTESTRIEAPTDKKRIALLNGACGQADRLRICGQVVDVPVTDAEKDEPWDPFLGLPLSLGQSIRPMHDFSMRSVRRARLQVEVLNTTPGEFRANGSDGHDVLYESEEFATDDDSFFAHHIKPDIPPGQYVVRIILRGIDSLRQSASDLAYIRNGDSLILKKDIPIGYGRITVLPDDYDRYVLTSDIDQTFLDTPLHSSQGLLETLFQTPAAKAPVPGLPLFYKEIQKAGGTRLPTLFISASPHFFRRTLSAVFDHYDIDIAGLHLKYLLSTFDNIFRKLTHSIFNFNEFFSQGIGQSVERTLKFLGSSFQSLFDQVAYKLITLLENRLMQPTGAQEVLMGDNTEGDYFIFTLYQYLLLGRITGKDLENYLYRLNFLDREALTRDSAQRIRALVEENIALHSAMNPVVAVWINQSNEEPDDSQMFERINSSLPEDLRQTFESGEDGIVLPAACRAGIGFALAAMDRGLLTADQAARVILSTEGQEYREHALDRSRIVAIIDDFRFSAATKESIELLRSQIVADSG